jgi:hypothetical protein
VELAIATNIPPAAWSAEDDETIVTALDVMRVQAERMRERHGR